MKNKKEECCLECKDHLIIDDPDPDDWFCDDDSAVVCTLMPNDKKNMSSRYLADKSEFKTVTTSCRPYNLRKEATIPEWCPKKEHEKHTKTNK